MNNNLQHKTVPTSKTSNQTSAGYSWPLGLHHKGAWLVIGIVLVGLALISFFGLKSLHSSNTSSAQAAITIGSGGFTPAEIHVKSGTQITWTNTDSKAHQVAADPYPKNNSIPGFNSNVLLQAGDSYSFTFTKTGTYHLHDQLNPFKLMGNVVVR